MPDVDKQKNCDDTGFSLGSFPFSHLGISMYTSSLKAADCEALAEKITSKTRTWTRRLLSYAAH